MLGELVAPMEVDYPSSVSATTTMLVSKRSHPDSVLKDPTTTAPRAPTAIDLHLIWEDDAHYEQDILRDLCSSLNSWLRYLEYKAKTGSINGQVFVFERACKALPRSYKLWENGMCLLVLPPVLPTVFICFLFWHCLLCGGGAGCLMYGDSHWEVFSMISRFKSQAPVLP